MCVCVCLHHGQRLIIIVQFPFNVPSWGIRMNPYCASCHMQISSQKRAGDCGKLAWDMAAKAACRRSQRGFFSMNICFQPDQKRSPFQPWPTGYQGSYNEIKRLAGWTRYWPQVEALMITTLTMKDRTMTNRWHVISESSCPRTSQPSDFQCFPLVPIKSPLILRCNWKSKFQDERWSFDTMIFLTVNTS